MKPPGLPSTSQINALPTEPLRVLFSGCLARQPCGVEGTDYGSYPKAETIVALPNVEVTTFCPEDFAFGTPRETCNVVGGDGFAVLQGTKRVITHQGSDWTEGLIRAADRMLELARNANIDLAILMDISAACGSTVIYDGHRDNKVYQQGVGVCAARLINSGIPVISQRDFHSLEVLHKHLAPEHAINPAARDHHKGDWYLGYFQEPESL